MAGSGEDNGAESAVRRGRRWLTGWKARCPWRIPKGAQQKQGPEFPGCMDCGCAAGTGPPCTSQMTARKPRAATPAATLVVKRVGTPAAGQHPPWRAPGGPQSPPCWQKRSRPAGDSARCESTGSGGGMPGQQAETTSAGGSRHADLSMPPVRRRNADTGGHGRPARREKREAVARTGGRRSAATAAV